MTPGSKMGVIVVAEDPFVCNFVRSILSRKGYQVISKETHRIASLISSGELQCDLIITNSPEPLTPVNDRIRLLYIAAMPDFELAGKFPFCSVLRKPFHPSDLLESVNKLLGI